MSHFQVLCVGNVKHNMAPFHEFECDGIDDEFIKTIEITESVRKDFEHSKAKYQEELAKYNKDIELASEELKKVIDRNFERDTRHSFKGTTFKEYLMEYEDYTLFNNGDEIIPTELNGAKYDYAIAMDDTDDNIKVYKRTNPNYFYDHYDTGSNLLLLKNGKYTNHAFKRDLDIEGMYKNAETEAREKYNKVIERIGGRPTLEISLAALRKNFSPKDGSEPTMTREQAEDLYEAQTAVKKWTEIARDLLMEGLISWNTTLVDEFDCSEDEYVRNCAVHCLTYGYVVNREYHSEGDMGWWSISTNLKEPDSWDKEYEDFFKNLPDDAELTVLNCHV